MSAPKDYKEFLDTNQYAMNSLLRYEWVFGHTYVSTGGYDTTKECCESLKLSKDDYVLDVGCGVGGSAYHMAEQYGARVLGIDLSCNMLAVAQQRLQHQAQVVKDNVEFKMADATTVELDDGTFDVIYSRDTILHIEDKLELFTRFCKWLKPGGRLLITDYCKGDKEQLSEEFISYVKKRDYKLLTIKEYGKKLETAGFTNVQAIDNNKKYTSILEAELQKLQEGKEKFLENFSENDFKELTKSWTAKIRRTKAGDQAFGLFLAEAPQ